MSDFVNLTRGLLCGCDIQHPHFLRIQSTHCEQKLWGRVLHDAGPDLLMHFAWGEPVTVHDLSEKPRVTRALWQGLPWIRYATERIWNGSALTEPMVRGGVSVSGYFDEQFRLLDKSVVKWVGYFGKHWCGEPIKYDLCARVDIPTD